MLHSPVQQLIKPRRILRLPELPDPVIDFDFVSRPSMQCPGYPPITFTRASVGYRVNASGLLESMATDAPRFDHDPLTGARRGPLIEEARTNLCLRSEEIDNASWTKDRSAVTANDHTAPDGAATMDLLTEDTTASNTHQAQQGVTVSNSTVYCLSAFLKKKDRHFCLGVNTANVIVAFNLDTGVAAASFGTVVASGVMPYPNGVYRCWFSFTTTSTSETILLMLASAATIGGRIYNGDGASGSWAWGVVLEQGAFPTSYIKTEGATATRAADVASLSLGPWFNPNEGTILGEFSVLDIGRGYQPEIACLFQDGTTTNRIDLAFADPSGDVATVFARTASDGTQFNDTFGAAMVAANTPYRAAFAWKAGDAIGAGNGVLGTLDTSFIVPTMDTLQLGAFAGGSQFALNGHLRRVCYWLYRLPNGVVQVVTA